MYHQSLLQRELTIALRGSTVAVVLYLLTACMASETTRQHGMTDVSWISIGHTTRIEVIDVFGQPVLSTQTTYEGALAVYEEYRTLGDRQGTAAKTPPLALEPRPEGAGPQAFQPPIESLVESGESSRLWIVFDEQGIVKDFGFGSSTMAPSRSVQ